MILLFNTISSFPGLELPMLSTEQLSPAPSIHHNQLMSFSENFNQLMSYSENKLHPTPHSPLPEELILQKPPTGPSTSWFQRWTTWKEKNRCDISSKARRGDWLVKGVDEKVKNEGGGSLSDHWSQVLSSISKYCKVLPRRISERQWKELNEGEVSVSD